MFINCCQLQLRKCYAVTHDYFTNASSTIPLLKQLVLLALTQFKQQMSGRVGKEGQNLKEARPASKEPQPL